MLCLEAAARQGWQCACCVLRPASRGSATWSGSGGRVSTPGPGGGAAAGRRQGRAQVQLGGDKSPSQAGPAWARPGWGRRAAGAWPRARLGLSSRQVAERGRPGLKPGRAPPSSRSSPLSSSWKLPRRAPHSAAGLLPLQYPDVVKVGRESEIRKTVFVCFFVCSSLFQRLT